MSIRLTAQLPKGEGNGLDAIASDLVRDPSRIRVVVALVDAQRTIAETDTGDTMPVVRIRRIEAISDPDDGKMLMRLLTRAWEQRTGQATLPLEMEAEIEAALGVVDPNAPEGPGA